MVDQARNDLAQRVSAPADQITVVRVEAREWPDSSLGCPKPGMMYAQVITPGYLVVLSFGGQTYEYHTDRGRNAVLCTQGR